MTHPRQFVEQCTADLGATPLQKKSNHLGFKLPEHKASIKWLDGPRPCLTLSVERSYCQDPAQRHGPPMEVPEPPHVTLTADAAIARAELLSPLNKDYQSDDPGFDARIYIDANGAPQDYINYVLQQPGVTHAISTLLDAGYDKIILDAEHDCASATRQICQGDATTVRAHSALLATIADAVPSSQAATARPGLTSKLLKVTLISIVPAFILNMIFQYIWPIYGPRWIEPWALACPVWFAALLLLIPVLKRDKGAANDLIGFIFALLFFTLLTVNLTLCAVNTLADRSPPRSLKASVLDLQSTRSKNSTNYAVTLDLHDGLPPAKHDISSNDYDVIHGRDTIHVIMGRGALGWPWIARFDP